MTTMNLDKLVWIDLETTGLDETKGHILEIGIIITDRWLDRIGPPWTTVVRPSLGVDLMNLREDVVAMHSRSGLFAEVVAATGAAYHTGSVAGAAASYIEACEAVGSPLCGASVHFDRRWLMHHMPGVLTKLHYRNFDVSTFRIMAELVGAPLPEKREAHRVIPDLEDAIALARWARDRFGVSP